MKNNETHDSGSLKELAAILPGATPGVINESVAKSKFKPVSVYGSWGDTSHPFWGIVYRRWLTKPGCVDDCKSYVGETMDEAVRVRSWNKVNSPDYAGSKISNARNQYGVAAWGYEVLEVVYAESKDECRKLLYERETYYIEKFIILRNLTHTIMASMAIVEEPVIQVWYSMKRGESRMETIGVENLNRMRQRKFSDRKVLVALNLTKRKRKFRQEIPGRSALTKCVRPRVSA